MADYLVKEEQLSDIAAAIRSKTGSSDGLEVTEMASAINGNIYSPEEYPAGWEKV